MPHAEQQPIAADPCATGSPPSELQSPPSSVTEECASAKASPSTGNSSPGAGKTSKRFVDEDSKSPEYRSDTWRMANFKVRDLYQVEDLIGSGSSSNRAESLKEELYG